MTARDAGGGGRFPTSLSTIGKIAATRIVVARERYIPGREFNQTP